MTCAATSTLRRFRDCSSGGLVIVFALLLPIVIGLIGMSVDFAVWLRQREHLQIAADAAAVAGALVYLQTGERDRANVAARSSLAAHNSSEADATFDFTDEGYEVRLKKKGTKYFAGVMPLDPPVFNVSATADAVLPKEEPKRGRRDDRRGKKKTTPSPHVRLVH
jgi:Flp pilus assembly protein TadG